MHIHMHIDYLGVSDMNGYVDVVSEEEKLGLIRVSLGLYNTIERS